MSESVMWLRRKVPVSMPVSGLVSAMGALATAMGRRWRLRSALPKYTVGGMGTADGRRGKGRSAGVRGACGGAANLVGGPCAPLLAQQLLR